MQALGRHMASCSKRPQSAGGGEDLCVDVLFEGEGEEIFDGGEEDFEDPVEVDDVDMALNPTVVLVCIILSTPVTKKKKKRQQRKTISTSHRFH